VQKFRGRLSEGLTQDGFNLLTSVYVGWKVSDPTAFFPPVRRQREPDWGGGSAPGPMAGNANRHCGKQSLCPILSPLATTAPISLPSRAKSWRRSSPSSKRTTSGWRSHSSASSGCNSRKASARDVFGRMTSRTEGAGWTDTKGLSEAEAQRTAQDASAGRRTASQCRRTGDGDPGQRRGRSGQIAQGLPTDPELPASSSACRAGKAP